MATFEDESPRRLRLENEAHDRQMLRRSNMAKQQPTKVWAPPGKHIQIYKDSRGKWRYRVVAANWQNTGNAGQGYASLAGAKRAAKRDHPGVLILLKAGR